MKNGTEEVVPHLAPRQKELEFVHKVRKFGETILGLDFGESFKEFDPELSMRHWLYVSPKDKIESALKRKGKPAPFKSGWDRERLDRSRKWYIGRGFDTYLFSAEAHGGGKCPITPGLLASERTRQGYVIIHEGWHTTVKAKGVRMPYLLEEATGRVVGNFGIINFAKQGQDKTLLAQSIAQEKEWRVFANFVNYWYRKMVHCYRSGLPSHELLEERESLFQKARTQAQNLSQSFKTKWEKKELLQELNNAFLLRYYDYTRYYELALQILNKTHSLKEAATIFIKAGKDRNAAIRMLRQILREN